MTTSSKKRPTRAITRGKRCHEELFRVMEDSYGMTKIQLLGVQRWQPLAMFRQILHALAAEMHPNVSMAELAKDFNRHRTAIIFSRDSVKEWCETDRMMKARVDDLRRKLKIVVDNSIPRA